MAKLKVFRTPAGFDDAYVAAPSQKAALAAWGSKADLFARRIAEVVTDPALTAAPLADPGTVIKRARTAADAAPEPPRRPPAKEKVSPVAKATPKPKAKPKPRPSRVRLDRTEEALAASARNQKDARAALDREQAALTKRRRALLAQQYKETARLETAQSKARADYDRALERWRK